MNLAIHDADTCTRLQEHCAWHGIDEPEQPGDYQTCGECGHIYRTAGELRRAHLRSVWQYVRRPGPLSGRPRDRWGYLVRAIRLPVRDQCFCPLCGHDFHG